MSSFERLTICRALARSASKYPESVSLAYMGRDITFKELENLTNRFARALLDLGVKKGDKVALLLPNMPQFIIANIAALKIGAVVVPANPLLTERELEHQFVSSEATVLIMLDLLMPRIMKIKDNTNLKLIIPCHINDYLPFPKKQLFPIIKKDLFRKTKPQPGVYDFLDLVRKYPAEPVEDHSQWDGLAALVYTGGTTGTSKGVMLTHKNFVTNAQQFLTYLEGVQAGESNLAVFPFFHAGGYTILQVLSIYKALKLVIIVRPTPEAIIESIEKYKIDYLGGAPTIWVALLNDDKFCSMDLSSIKLYFNGAGPIAPEVTKKLKEVTGAVVRNCYGLTEATTMVTVPPYGDEKKVNTVGMPVPETEVKIVDSETGTRDMPQGEAGEIIVRGPQVMQGYFKNPEDTKTAIRDGWLYTGDIGQFDEDGFLSIVDRKKDVIIAGGYNIYPSEIDEVLYEHPKILEACAIGVPDEYRGETVKAYIVLKQEQSLTEEEIIQYCKEYLAAYKVPKQVEFIDSLPKNAIGKVLRRELRHM